MIGIIMCLVVIVIVLLKRAYFVFQTPEFCILICVGGILCYVSVILLLPDTLTDGMCFAHLWLFGIGFWAVYAAIMLKNFRIFWVMSNAQKMKITKVAVWEIALVMIFCFILEAIFQVIWDSVEVVRPYLSYAKNNEARTYVVYCAGIQWMWLGAVLVRVCLFIPSAAIAYLSRGLSKEQNYSKETALVIYTVTIILIVSIPIGFAVTSSPDLVVFLKGISICLGIMATIIIIFFDPIKRIIQGKEPRRFQSSAQTGTSSGMSGGAIGSNLVNSSSVASDTNSGL